MLVDVVLILYLSLMSKITVMLFTIISTYSPLAAEKSGGTTDHVTADSPYVRYHIYADTQLYVECPPTDHRDASRYITECVEDLRRWMTDNRLMLNEDKTEAIFFRSSCPVASTINIGGSVAQLQPTVCDIGVVLDTRLDMASQVSNVCRSDYYHLFRIAKIRPSLTVVACKTLVHALVISRVDYGNAPLL